MNDKDKLKKQIYELDCALHELVLFLDSHPNNRRAMELMREYREKRSKLISEYEQKFGKYIVTVADIPMSGRWEWLDGPWPWDTDFMEG